MSTTALHCFLKDCNKHRIHSYRPCTIGKIILGLGGGGGFKLHRMKSNLEILRDILHTLSKFLLRLRSCMNKPNDSQMRRRADCEKLLWLERQKHLPLLEMSSILFDVLTANLWNAGLRYHNKLSSKIMNQIHLWTPNYMLIKRSEYGIWKQNQV